MSNVDYIRRFNRTITSLLILTITLAVLSLLVGQFGTSLLDTIRLLIKPTLRNTIEALQVKKIILGIRIPRTLASIVVGGTLSIAGVTYQSVFRNRLASQDILGVNTGACVGAALAIVCNLSVTMIQTMSFVFGILTIVLVFLLAKLVREDNTLSLILSGILIGGVMSSILGLIKYMASPEKHLQAIVFWTMGDISGVSLKQLLYILVPVGVASLMIVINRWNLTYFSFSDSEARSIGVKINVLRVVLIIAATLIVASDVSIAGSIGWVGLAVPQLARLVVGENNRYTIPTTFFMGSSFLLLVDIINRTISTAELPISIISGILGVPVFIICLYVRKKRKSYS